MEQTRLILFLPRKKGQKRAAAWPMAQRTGPIEGIAQAHRPTI